MKLYHGSNVEIEEVDLSKCMPIWMESQKTFVICNQVFSVLNSAQGAVSRRRFIPASCLIRFYLLIL